jgi:ABC-type nitrate/sulfonate/bicarbonate transport system permease component
LPYCDLSRRDRRQSEHHLVGQSDGHVRKQASLPHHFPSIAAYIFGDVRVTVPVALIMALTMEMTAGGGGLGGALMYAQHFFKRRRRSFTSW